MLIKVNNFPPLFLAEIICAINLRRMCQNGVFVKDRLNTSAVEKSLVPTGSPEQRFQGIIT